jgi:hypothetical protein
MCCIDGQENKYSVLNECSRMLKYNILYYGIVLYYYCITSVNKVVHQLISRIICVVVIEPTYIRSIASSQQRQHNNFT